MTAKPFVETETALIPEGYFTMGDDAHRPDERPAHRVWISTFRMALRPVTNEEYAAFLAATPHEPPRFWEDPIFNAPGQPAVRPCGTGTEFYADRLRCAAAPPSPTPSRQIEQRTSPGKTAICLA